MKVMEILVPEEIANKIEGKIVWDYANKGSRFLDGTSGVATWHASTTSQFKLPLVTLKEPDCIKLARLTVKVWNRLYPFSLNDEEKEQLKLANKMISEYERGVKTG